MKTLLAIPNKEQVKYLEQMVAHIEAMSVKADKVLYLQDRPSAREMVDCRKILSGNSLIEQVVVRDQPEHMGHPQTRIKIQTTVTNTNCFLATVVFGKR